MKSKTPRLRRQVSSHNTGQVLLLLFHPPSAGLQAARVLLQGRSREERLSTLSISQFSW